MAHHRHDADAAVDDAATSSLKEAKRRKFHENLLPLNGWHFGTQQGAAIESRQMGFYYYLQQRVKLVVFSHNISLLNWSYLNGRFYQPNLASFSVIQLVRRSPTTNRLKILQLWDWNLTFLTRRQPCWAKDFSFHQYDPFCEPKSNSAILILSSFQTFQLKKLN